MIQCIEKIKGKVRLTQQFLFLEYIDDIKDLEFWEDRLEKFDEDYAVTYFEEKGVIYYNLYCNYQRKKSTFHI